MAIYTRFGSKIEIVSAEELLILVEHTRGGIARWHYSEPAKRLKTSSYKYMPVWHAVARYVEGEKTLLCDGNQIPVHEFRADNGVREILDVMRNRALRSLERAEQ